MKARKFAYAFLRGFMGPVLQDLVTYTVISDILRGFPAVYALYAGYDDLSHFAGMTAPRKHLKPCTKSTVISPASKRQSKVAPRPYHIVILSDHGQSLGPTFEAAHGTTLEKLVKSLVKT